MRVLALLRRHAGRRLADHRASRGARHRRCDEDAKRHLSRGRVSARGGGGTHGRLAARRVPDHGDATARAEPLDGARRAADPQQDHPRCNGDLAAVLARDGHVAGAAARELAGRRVALRVAPRHRAHHREGDHRIVSGPHVQRVGPGRSARAPRDRRARPAPGALPRGGGGAHRGARRRPPRDGGDPRSRDGDGAPPHVGRRRGQAAHRDGARRGRPRGSRPPARDRARRCAAEDGLRHRADADRDRTARRRDPAERRRRGHRGRRGSSGSRRWAGGSDRGAQRRAAPRRQHAGRRCARARGHQGARAVVARRRGGRAGLRSVGPRSRVDRGRTGCDPARDRAVCSGDRDVPARRTCWAPRRPHRAAVARHRVRCDAPGRSDAQPHVARRYGGRDRARHRRCHRHDRGHRASSRRGNERPRRGFGRNRGDGPRGDRERRSPPSWCSSLSPSCTAWSATSFARSRSRSPPR